MDQEYIKADNHNLPSVDKDMVQQFFVNNTDFVSAEVKNVKAKRSAKESYGDNAVGYVELYRTGNSCTVRAKITAEHKVRANYSVEAVIDEEAQTVISCKCKDCAASEGGCKHGIAFLLWLHRRSEESSVTPTVCYWKKSTLAKVGYTKMNLRSIVGHDLPVLPPKSKMYMDELVLAVPDARGDVFDFYNDTSGSSINIYQMHLKFSTLQANDDADKFIEFMADCMTPENCGEVESRTREQRHSPYWHEMRFGRITASKLYECARCKTPKGALTETILGSSQPLITDAITRGQQLESAVLQEVEKQRNVKLTKAGLFLHPKFPVFGASPDAVSLEYCVEVKCPFKESKLQQYVKDGIIAKKFYYQLQLQMHFANKKKGLFCVCIAKF